MIKAESRRERKERRGHETSPLAFDSHPSPYRYRDITYENRHILVCRSEHTAGKEDLSTHKCKKLYT
jgi:hypothetical protein